MLDLGAPVGWHALEGILGVDRVATLGQQGCQTDDSVRIVGSLVQRLAVEPFGSNDIAAFD